MAWRESFPKYSLKHLSHAMSDHYSILINLGIETRKHKPIWTNQRKKRNTVEKLKRLNRDWVKGEEEKIQVANDYFKELFTTSYTSSNETVLLGITRCIHEDMNTKLIEQFRSEEVREAMKNIAPSKVLCIDDYPALFYQKYWHIVGDEITKYCLDVLTRRKEIGILNITSIALMPKESSQP